MFINTLPIIFTYTSLFSLIEAVIFLTAIFFLVYFYSPGVNKNWIDKPGGSMYQFLHSAWLGNSALWRAFWPFFLFVNAILYYIDYRVMNVTYTIASWKQCTECCFCLLSGGRHQSGDAPGTPVIKFGAVPLALSLFIFF